MVAVGRLSRRTRPGGAVADVRRSAVLPMGRPFGIGGLLLLVFVPDAMVGYTRYQPWLSALGCLAVALAAERAEARIDARLVRWLSVAVVAALVLVAANKCCSLARDAACKAREAATVRERIRPPFWGDPKARYEASFRARDFAARYNYLTCMENRTKLLVRQLGREGTTVVEPAENWRPFLKMNVDWDERNWHRGGEPAEAPAPADPPAQDEKVEWWDHSPFGYWVPADGPTSTRSGLLGLCVHRRLCVCKLLLRRGAWERGGSPGLNFPLDMIK